MEGQGLTTGKFIKDKLNNFLTYFAEQADKILREEKETKLSSLPEKETDEHIEIEDFYFKLAEAFQTGFINMRKDLEETPTEKVIGMTLLAVRYLAPTGYLPLDHRRQQSIDWIKRFIIAVRHQFEQKMAKVLSPKMIELMFNHLSDEHIVKTIQYINCFSEVLQPGVFQAGQ